MTLQTTSLFAYRNEVRPTLSARQEAVMDVLADHEDMTNSEIAQALGWSINRITGRTNELVKLGKVREARKRTCRVTGRTAIAWRVV